MQSTTATSPIQVKFFIGYCQNSALKAHLHQSSTWREAQITSGVLKLVQYREADYIGLYREAPLTLGDLHKGARCLKEALQPHCPTLDLDHQAVHIFPQVFLS